MTQEERSNKEFQVLHSKFNIRVHKETFINYFEVIINRDGTVEYAVPSHQEKLIEVIETSLEHDRTWIMKNCPAEYYFNFIQWLCNVSGCISLWTDDIIKPESGITDKQRISLRILKDSGLYKGLV